MTSTPSQPSSAAFDAALAAGDFELALTLAEQLQTLAPFDRLLASLPAEALTLRRRTTLRKAQYLQTQAPLEALHLAAELDREVAELPEPERQAGRLPPLTVMLESALALGGFDGASNLALVLREEALSHGLIDVAAWAEWQRTEAFIKLERLDEALEAARTASGLAQRTSDRALQVATSALRGRLCYQQGLLTEAIEQFKHAHQSSQDSLERAHLELVSARMQIEYGHLISRHYSILQRALVQPTLKSVAERELAALGDSFVEGQLRSYQPALSLSPGHQTLIGQAIQSLSEDKAHEAVSYFDLVAQALLALDTGASRFARAFILLYRAQAAIQAGDFTSARADFGHVLEFALKLENIPLYANAAISLARLHVSSGFSSEALELLAEAHHRCLRFGSDSYALSLAAQRAFLALEAPEQTLASAELENTLNAASKAFDRHPSERWMGALGSAIHASRAGNLSAAQSYLAQAEMLPPSQQAEFATLLERVRRHLEQSYV